MARLNDTNLIPPSGWTFKDPLNGVVTTSNAYLNLIIAAGKRRVINGLELGNIEQDVNDYLCSHNPPNFCGSAFQGLGDIVELFAKPIAKALGLPENCSGCARRKQKLNEAVPL